MNLKNVFVIALLAAANHAGAQQVPPPRHLSEEILAAEVKPDNYRTEEMRPENIAWSRSVWRDIDVKQKANKAFDAKPGDEHSLYNTLVTGVTSGRIKAYHDDQFEKEIPGSQLVPWLRLVGSQLQSANNELQVTKFQLKEDSVHLRSEDRTEVHRLGIMPIALQAGPNGGQREQPLFWISYPDALRYLAEMRPTTLPDFTWADVLESSSFYATIAKQGKKESKEVINPKLK